MSVSKHVMFESRSDDFYLLIKNVDMYVKVGTAICWKIYPYSGHPQFSV